MDSNSTLPGRHYETGVIANALQLAGFVDPITNSPYDEALVFGASGGLAFGYFVFEYTGHLPHVAILTRNTFAPIETALDNLAIEREQFESTKAEKGRDHLLRELDFGNPVLAWADGYSLKYTGHDPQTWYGSRPFLITGYDESSYHVVDGGYRVAVPREEFEAARGRLKKDRFRIMVLSAPDESQVREGVRRGLETCLALYFDAPPAGAAHNFGAAGLAHWEKMLREKRNANCWRRKFEAGPRLNNALAGNFIQPGVYEWIELWGTAPGADRATFAAFLRQAATRMNLPTLSDIADDFDVVARAWSELAEIALPVEIEEYRQLRALLPVPIRRTSRDRMAELREAASDKLAALAEPLYDAMADGVAKISAMEVPVMEKLRSAIRT